MPSAPRLLLQHPAMPIEGRGHSFLLPLRVSWSPDKPLRNIKRNSDSQIQLQDWENDRLRGVNKAGLFSWALHPREVNGLKSAL